MKDYRSMNANQMSAELREMAELAPTPDLQECYQHAAALLGVAQGARKTVDAYSYCKGLEMAAVICEKAAKPWNGDEVEPAAPVHARILRGLIDGYGQSSEHSEGMRGWRRIDSAPKGTRILGAWLNGEVHTGSICDGQWLPAWEHQNENWMMPTHWMSIEDLPPLEELRQAAGPSQHPSTSRGSTA